jgi:hypothetical protein
MRSKKRVEKSPAHCGLYQAILSCKIARDGIDGKVKIPLGITRIEYVLYNLAHAVEELAKERMEYHEKKGEF